MGKVWREFRSFAMGANVIELALGFIIGAAFSKLVEAFAQNIVMDSVAVLFGQPAAQLPPAGLGAVRAGQADLRAGPGRAAQLRAAGVPVLPGVRTHPGAHLQVLPAAAGRRTAVAGGGAAPPRGTARAPDDVDPPAREDLSIGARSARAVRAVRSRARHPGRAAGRRTGGRTGPSGTAARPAPPGRGRPATTPRPVRPLLRPSGYHEPPVTAAHRTSSQHTVPGVTHVRRLGTVEWCRLPPVRRSRSGTVWSVRSGPVAWVGSGWATTRCCTATSR